MYRESATLTLECPFSVINIELFIKKNEAIFRYPDDHCKIIEFFKIWDKQSKDHDFSKQLSTEGTENLKTDRELHRTMVSSNQKDNTQIIFSTHQNDEISSITIKSSENFDISENVKKLTEDFFGNQRYAYDSNHNTIPENFDSQGLIKHDENDESDTMNFQKKIEAALDIDKDKLALYDPQFIKNIEQHYVSKNSTF